MCVPYNPLCASFLPSLVEHGCSLRVRCPSERGVRDTHGGTGCPY